MKIENLHEFIERTIAEANIDFLSEDRVLPQAFVDYVNNSNQGDKYIFNKYTTLVRTELSIYCPNQWFFIAAYYCRIYPLLKSYKELVWSCIPNDVLPQKYQELFKGFVGEKEKALTFVDALTVDPEDKDCLAMFLSNYEWWHGGKGIERNDFYYSPILSSARLVNQSQSFVAEICKFLVDNPDALNILNNDLIPQQQQNKIINHCTPFQQIFYGPPGTGKSHEVKRITGELEGGSKPNVFRTTFHPDTDYASFVGCYKPVMKPVPENLRAVAGREEDIAYEFVPQAFTDAYIYAYNHTEETTYLVIEEINRGNCAQIFGDLFQLLDRNENGTSDYSIKADKDLAKYLIDTLGSDSPGIKDGKLSLPANLRILATMNTSDQSLFPIDSAFKRRWDWEYVAIDYAEPKSSAFTITIGNTSFRWVDFIKVVNQRIYDVTQSEDKQMGNFFIKSSVNQKQFCSKVMFYLWNEVLKDEVENSKYFFYEDKGNNQTSKFTFTDVYGGNATSVLISFMKYLGVNPLQNQTAQNEEQQTDTDVQ